MTVQPQRRVTHLRGGGTSVLLTSHENHPPRVLHWGADLGDLPAEALDAWAAACQETPRDQENTPLPATLLPQIADGWLGTPGLQCDRNGTAWAPKLRVTSWREHAASDGVGTLTVELADPDLQIQAILTVEVERSGLVRQRVAVTNLGGTDLEVGGVLLRWPIPARAGELLDLAGSWGNERHPQRMPLRQGRWARESRQGKPGCDGPLLMAAGVPGFGHERGEVWVTHLGWSGNQVLAASRNHVGVQFLEGGELLWPGEVVLAAGETYDSPWLYGSWGEGLNDAAARFHAHVRQVHAGSARVPVLANTWEATYFDQSMTRYTELAQASADVGVELFVVDDGWFGHRDNDETSLGDWFVDRRKWPRGLEPLSEAVHSLGMKFGLWVEPEMISLDSDAARQHPEWVFNSGHGPGLPSRHQYVLDLTNPDAYHYIASRLDALVRELSIDYLKWDHNRPLFDAGRQAFAGRAGVHAQTLATYRLMRQLKADHPGLLIESCSAGGGRIDLGIMDICDRVWTSDNNDPIERLRIQPWTALLLPPEFLGCHIGDQRAHVTQRMTDLRLRAHVAMWGDLGLELDATAASPKERSALTWWIARHKEWRELLHSGRFVSADRADGTVMWGVVAADGSAARYLIARTGTAAAARPDPLRLPGLIPGRSYAVEVGGGVRMEPVGTGPLPGTLLTDAGFPTPSLNPGASLLVSVVAR